MSLRPVIITHAGDRSAERMGVGLDTNDLHDMLCKIRTGGAIRLNDRRNGAHSYCVTHKGRAFRIVVNPELTAVITVLDPMGKRHGFKKRGRAA